MRLPKEIDWVAESNGIRVFEELPDGYTDRELRTAERRVGDSAEEIANLVVDTHFDVYSNMTGKTRRMRYKVKRYVTEVSNRTFVGAFICFDAPTWEDGMIEAIKRRTLTANERIARELVEIAKELHACSMWQE